MSNGSLSSRIKKVGLLGIISILTLTTLSCQVLDILSRKTIADQYRDFQIENTQIAYETSEVEDLIFSDNSESVLEDDASYGSTNQESSEADHPDPAAVPDPISKECGAGGICVATYPVDIRGTANPPDVIAWANSGEYAIPSGFRVTYTENAGPWYEWIVLMEPGDWIQAASPEGFHAAGVQFWGDQTNGWARVTLDGVEIWRGDVTAFGTDGTNYFVYVEASGIDPGEHTIVAEVLGQNGTGGGDNVPVFYFAYRK